MEIQISKLSGALKKIAQNIDNEGDQNNKINGTEASLFKATFAFMVRHFRASDFEYTSIFGESAFAEWTPTENVNIGGDSFEYADKKGNIIRGSFKNSGVSVYTENNKGDAGYYSQEMIMIPDEE